MNTLHRGYLSRVLSLCVCVVGVCVLTLGISPAAKALTVHPRSFPELVERADTIVVASVAGLRSAWSADGQVIYTFATLADIDVLKGDVPGATFELRMPGGVIGDQAQLYPGMPALEQGQRYVLFIHGHLREFFPLVGVNQGLYQVIRDASGEQRVRRADHHIERSASGVSVQLPTLGEFTARIRDRLSAHPETTP